MNGKVRGSFEPTARGTALLVLAQVRTDTANSDAEPDSMRRESLLTASIVGRITNALEATRTVVLNEERESHHRLIAALEAARDDMNLCADDAMKNGNHFRFQGKEVIAVENFSAAETYRECAQRINAILADAKEDKP